MKIETMIEIKEGIQHYFTIKISAQGEYIENISEVETLEPYQTAIYSYNGTTLMDMVKELEEKAMNEFKKELLLNNLKRNFQGYGYSRKLAIKEVMEEGYLVGFHYDLMGVASIERLNAKTATIEDMMGIKSYVDYDYINSLYPDELCILNKE